MNSKAVTVKVAVLDDYPNLAMRMADWSALKDRATITVFNDHRLSEPGHANGRLVRLERPRDNNGF